MKILHIAAGNRWTGAAAPAFAEVEALRAAGVDAHFAYVGGYKLEAKLAGLTFAHPVIVKAQNPISFRRSVRAIRQLMAEKAIDILHAHLTYDHWLSRFAARGTGARVARTFHARRTLRTDPFTRSLVNVTASLFVINEAFLDAPLLRGKRVAFTPPPLDARLFRATGPDVRARYSLDAAVPVLAVIGKLSPGRGFEEALRTFAIVRQASPAARLMVIGHGEHRPALERLAAALGIEPAVIWAGYHEGDLPEHYRAANVLLFTAPGSDEGHRAVIEALGCGLPAAVYPIAGMSALLGPMAGSLVAPESTPAALAGVVLATLSRDRSAWSQPLMARVEQFTFEAAARRLIEHYSRRDGAHDSLL